MECRRYNFCLEEFTGWVQIPTKQQIGQNINIKSRIEIASFTEENRVSRE